MPTQVIEDESGNLIEDDLEQRRFRPGIDDDEANAIDAAAVAASQSETSKDAEKKIKPGGKAALDHGAPVGAQNALKFHAWQKGEE